KTWSSKKKNAKKMGKTISLTDFLAEDGSTGGGSMSVPKPVSWTDLEDVSTSGTVMMTACIRNHQLTTAPQAPLTT
uniref:Uncharacterized protein n=1 Tax=Ursus americanus TaxID=9643 RepID=A0A452QKH8_URSAM